MVNSRSRQNYPDTKQSARAEEDLVQYPGDRAIVLAECASHEDALAAFPACIQLPTDTED